VAIVEYKRMLLRRALSVGICLLIMKSSFALQASGSRVVFVTGATDGIGKHTAELLAEDGHTLIVHGRRADAGNALVRALKDRGATDAVFVRADLNDLAQVKSLASEVSQLTAELDVLCNNAGVFDPAEPTSKQGFETTWAVNVLAPFVLTRELLPLLGAASRAGRDTRVVTTSSISQSWALPKDLASLGAVPKSGHQAYSESKLGDHLFTVGLASRLEASGDPALAAIKCLTMDPGTVNTKMLLAGWGPCGIPVKRANNTYKLAAGREGLEAPNGEYLFGGSGSADARDKAKVDAVWALLEDQTKCSYADLSNTLT